MPPSPVITATLNEPRWLELCESIGLNNPPTVRIRLTQRPNAAEQVLGTHCAVTNSINVNFGFPSDTIERLRFMQSDLVNTLLHEVRHAWQYQTWGEEWMRTDDKLPYALRHKEKDANQFAETHQTLWRGLVRVGRKQHGSNFSKLSRHVSHRMV